MKLFRDSIDSTPYALSVGSVSKLEMHNLRYAVDESSILIDWDMNHSSSVEFTIINSYAGYLIKTQSPSAEIHNLIEGTESLLTIKATSIYYLPMDEVQLIIEVTNDGIGVRYVEESRGEGIGPITVAENT